MKIFEVVERFSRMVELLENEQTGSAAEFAKKLGISRSQLFNYFDYLRDFDIKIDYDSPKNSYVFAGSNKIIIQQPIKILENTDSISINGGTSFNIIGNKIDYNYLSA